MSYRRRFRAGRQSIGDAARSLLDGLGMGDYDDQARSRRIFNELYTSRFAGQVDFLGIRSGVVYLRVRDGSWVRRVKAFETQLLHDLVTLGDLNSQPKRVSIKVGAPQSEDV